MKALGIVALTLVCVGAVATGIFFLTPAGRAAVTGYQYEMDKASEGTYENKKTVEETLRGYYSSYLADKNGYMTYKDMTDEYYVGLAQSYRQRANSTAITYNEYFTKNSFVFKGNVPSDLPSRLEVI